MIHCTCNHVPGYQVKKILGLVHGSSIRSAHLGQDITAFLKNLVGGELEEYTKMMAECREQSLDRMNDMAEHLGANAVISIRFSTSDVASGAAEILVYGTAVSVEKEKEPTNQ